MMESYRIDRSKGIEIGLYSLGDHFPDAQGETKVSEAQRLREIIKTAQLAEDADLDVIGIGESHQEFFITSANQVVLGAIAQATEKIKIASSVTVLSTADPVRVYEEYATIDLLSEGRAEIVAGRASRLGAFELLGYNVNDYEALFEEKMELLIKLNTERIINWEGKYRASLENAVIYPRPYAGKLPIWRGVGGPPSSAIKAGYQGVPMMLTTLGGHSAVFKESVDVYRHIAAESGHDPALLPVGTTTLAYINKDSQQAMREYYPYLNHAWQHIRGGDYPKSAFAETASTKNAMMVGSPQQIIDKMLYQYELYKHDRILLQIDFGGVPYDKVANTIELLATEVLPVVKKATKVTPAVDNK
ncbi:LLM class flavin-dependent oxidoreductase [Sphingobacterium nematocida]|nr:LLM class flavin-dependent oxidoreductase [Sphingobacterium nematocida]